jgi:uncharacterized small protein (DUF1192 family)
MVEEQKERWRELCELALHEQDPEKLLRLTREINRLLAEREQTIASRTSAEAESLHKAS